MQTRETFSQQRRDYWQQQLSAPKKYDGFSSSYHRRLEQIFDHNIQQGSRVLELGCGTGELLASTRPARGVGIDFCQQAVDIAKQRYPGLEFRCLDAHDISTLDEKFDYVILSDLINDVYDVEEVLRQLRSVCTSETRILTNFHSHLWSGVLQLAQRFGFATRLKQQNWLTKTDFCNLLTLTGFDFIRNSEEVVLPVNIPLLANLVNRVVPRIWPLNHLALSHFMVARPIEVEQPAEPDGVSIIVAARNEEGHIESLIDQIPVLGRNTEVIFVEGGSSDNTYAEIEKNLNRRQDLEISLYRQPGKGKADAVRLGFDQAKYDILMILDADISVMPADLERFYRAISENKGEFINGVRLVYPMEDKAMRLLNLIGNKFFSYGFRFSLGQPIKDTLCGTKVVSRSNYQRIVRNRHYFGDFDPFGDFDLIFGAAKLNLKIIDVPIRYQARMYGETNINRWTGGLLLLRMLGRSLISIKFV